MSVPSVTDATYPTADELLAQLLSDVRWSYAHAGLAVNVAQGSELWYRYRAIANRLAIVLQNSALAVRDGSPLDAEGDALDTLCSLYGVARRAATPARGSVRITLRITGSVTIPAGFECTSAVGIVYATTASVTVPTNATVQVEATSAGAGTNLDAGQVVTWNSATIGGLVQTAVVATGGLDGGADADSDETLRQRLLYRLSYPATGGNPAQVAEWCSEALTGVEQAFVYPAVRGPASYDVALTSSDADRSLSSTNQSAVAAYLLARMPGSADLNLTGVVAQVVDVIINAKLPLPVNAGGAGGGWRDATPWPSSSEPAVCANMARVTSIANLATLRQITVSSTAADAPAIGKHFAIWNEVGGDDGLGAFHEFSIQAVGGGAGAYVLTLDAGTESNDFISVGDYCSAGAVNLKAYGTAFRDALKMLGPGEKSSSVLILPRGRRCPSPDVAWPTDLTSLQLDEIARAHSEVLDLAYVFRTVGGSTVLARTSPSVTATTADPPHVLTLGRLAIRRLV